MIIGVSGKIGAGKDAVADFLVKAHGFKIVRFSDSLKEEVLRIMRKTCEEIWYVYNADSTRDKQNKFRKSSEDDLRRMLWDDKPPIIRRLLQEWGTELRRAEDPNYWIWKWNDAVRPLLAAGISVVAPDTRFQNEAAAVHLLGGYVLRVERPGLPVGDHASETEQDSITFDRVIQNIGTLDDLAVRVDKFLSSSLSA